MVVKSEVIPIHKPKTFHAEIHEWEEFGRLCAREGDGNVLGRNSKRSQVLRDFIHKYNERHRKGNPQLLIEGWTKPAKPTVGCYSCARFDVPLWKVLFVSGAMLPTCKDCLEKAKKKRLVKKVISLI